MGLIADQTNYKMQFVNQNTGKFKVSRFKYREKKYGSQEKE